MPRPLGFALVLPLSLGFGALACDDDGHDDGHAEHAHEESDTHDATEGETHGEADCEAETRDDEFMVGLSKSGASVTVTFVSADPAPPGMGDNTWMVSLSDPDASVTAVTPYMPDHGHGTPVEAIVNATDPGEFTITPVNLFMAGLWEVTLDILTGAGTTEQVVFAFCVE